MNASRELGHGAAAATPADVVNMGCVPCACVPVREMDPFQIDCSISCLFDHRQSINWRLPVLHSYILALQRRACTVIAGHMCDNVEITYFKERRAQWSCAIAVLKNACLRATHSVVAPTVSTTPEFRAWLSRTVSKWDGPRMRESIALAYRRRMVRVDEVGRDRAFGGQSTLYRARGSLDVTEGLIHSLDLGTLVALPEDECVSLVRILQDITVMKVFTNCLEWHVQVYFASDHVVLDSLREMWATDNMPPQNDTRAVHTCETMGGFTLRGADSEQVEFTSFSAAALAWYDKFMGDTDPLEIHTTCSP